MSKCMLLVAAYASLTCGSKEAVPDLLTALVPTEAEGYEVIQLH